MPDSAGDGADGQAGSDEDYQREVEFFDILLDADIDAGEKDGHCGKDPAPVFVQMMQGIGDKEDRQQNDEHSGFLFGQGGLA